jgi:NAD(P)H-flavin reductase
VVGAQAKLARLFICYTFCMFDLLTRAFFHPFDYIGVVRCRTLFLISHTESDDNIHTFVFKPTKPLTWRAGQHAIFTLPEANVNGKTWRPFSVASSAHEGVIQISTVIPSEASDFKKKLLRLRHDDPIRMYGPFGEFHASRKKQHIVGIAGGIGITPFRALAYEISRRHLLNTRLTLIYSAREAHTYRHEFSTWQNNYLRVMYVHTKEDVEHALKTQYDLHGNRADYYVSGSPAMITSISAYAQTLGISKIVSDPFKGY